MTTSDKLSAAFERFDEANSKDPHRELHDGEHLPKELVYSYRMTQWLDRYAPNASEALKLAARCQHICRWEIPRDSYPKTRAGYRQWRSDLADFHAETAGTILRDVGYDDETISRVQTLLRKENLKNDPEVQTLEDIICFVFLENYFEEFTHEHEEEKLISILRKTAKKMSKRGHETVEQLKMPATTRKYLEKALAQD